MSRPAKPLKPVRMLAFAATFAIRTPENRFWIVTQAVTYFGKESVPLDRVYDDAQKLMEGNWRREGNGPPEGSEVSRSSLIPVCRAWVVGENRVHKEFRIKPQLDIDPSHN